MTFRLYRSRRSISPSVTTINKRNGAKMKHTIQRSKSKSDNNGDDDETEVFLESNGTESKGDVRGKHQESSAWYKGQLMVMSTL